MVFYINRVKIRIEYSFIIIIAFSLMMKNNSILYVLLFSSLHEIGHLAALLLFKCNPSEINLAFYGIGLKYRSNLSFYRELVFLFSGAMINILFAVFNVQREINSALAMINLIPIYPLDGGRAFKLILNKFFYLDASDKVFKIVSAILILILVLYSVLSKNISLILITIYIVVFSLNNSFD